MAKVVEALACGPLSYLGEKLLLRAPLGCWPHRFLTDLMRTEPPLSLVDGSAVARLSTAVAVP